jgi:6-phosphogluconolactonase/glucosamine-6-phosphate isomerase/deaminase
MKFIKQIDGLSEVLADALNNALQKYKRVIWLVPGGSNIKISVAAMKMIDKESSERLVLMQTDERFVDPKSDDCNWYQLDQAGFDTKRAETYPILTGNFDLAGTAEHYAKVVRKQFLAADYIFGQFGIGGDGHTAGIKPETLAAKSTELVIGYKAEDFQRVTLGFEAIKQINEAYVFAYGDDKKQALTKLADENLPLEQLPSGVLKQLKTLVVYNDQVER